MSREELHVIRREFLEATFDQDATKRTRRGRVIGLAERLNSLIVLIELRGGKATREFQLLDEMVVWLKANRVHNKRQRKQ